LSTLTLWRARNPFAEFDALMRRAFDGTVPARPMRSGGFVPAADIARDGDDAVVTIELPGVDVEKDVTVEIDRNRLIVRGERHDERTEQRDGVSLREVHYGSFRRSFGLPAHVEADALEASYDAGMLTVRIHGAYTGRQARQIPVTSAVAVESGATESGATESGAAESGEKPAASID
jgi:HSP20 family molecular chaperone IbpA